MDYFELFSKRTGLIILHPLLITFVLLTSYPIIYDIPTPFWYIILASFILATIFLLLRNRFIEKTVLYMIFLTDIPIIGFMIHYSGSLESMFPLLYVLLIILSALYLSKKGAYVISLCIVIFFAFLLFIEARDSDYSTQMVMYRFYIFGLLFLFTGILSGALSARYQKGTEEVERLRITTEEIIKNLPSGIITVSNKGIIIYTNIPEGPIRHRVHLYIIKLLKDPSAQISIKLEIAKRYYVLSCARIYDSKVGLGILQDYTEIRKLEEQSRISKQTKLLAELGGSLAHEIRNPLASIRGLLELIREARENSNTLHFINMALKESTRLNEIVTDFLNFAQFVPVKKNRLSISEIINEALIDIIHRVDSKNIKIVRQDSVFYVLGDLNKLKSCFANILNNACEASQKGQVIKIVLYSNNNEGFIEIRDYGKGILRREIKKIYDPFFTTKKGGTGLGLAIARNILESHGGRIEVKSKIGKGTTFKVILPLA